MTFQTLVESKAHPLLKEETWIDKPIEMQENAAAIRCGFRLDISLRDPQSWYCALGRSERAYLVAWHIMDEMGSAIAQYDYGERVRARRKQPGAKG